MGVLIIGTLTNGLGVLGVGEFYQLIFKGIVLLAAVGVDCIRREKMANKNGKYLYVSNRGANCVCVFEINEENGIPVLLQSVPTAGWPRALQFSENFKVLYILNEEYESSKGSLESYCVSRYGRLSDRTKLLDLENAYNFIRW